MVCECPSKWIAPFLPINPSTCPITRMQTSQPTRRVALALQSSMLFLAFKRLSTEAETFLYLPRPQSGVAILAAMGCCTADFGFLASSAWWVYTDGYFLGGKVISFAWKQSNYPILFESTSLSIRVGDLSKGGRILVAAQTQEWGYCRKHVLLHLLYCERERGEKAHRDISYRIWEHEWKLSKESLGCFLQKYFLSLPSEAEAVANLGCNLRHALLRQVQPTPGMKQQNTVRSSYWSNPQMVCGFKYIFQDKMIWHLLYMGKATGFDPTLFVNGQLHHESWQEVSTKIFCRDGCPGDQPICHGSKPNQTPTRTLVILFLLCGACWWLRLVDVDMFP